MSKESTKAWPPPMTDEDLKKWVLDYTAGRIYTHKQIENISMLTKIFMPLGFGVLKDRTKEDLNNIGLIWEYYEKAAPIGVNGMPIFYSCRLMDISDFNRVQEATVVEEQRRKEIVV